jgi:hypothetical protein
MHQPKTQASGFFLDILRRLGLAKSLDGAVRPLNEIELHVAGATVRHSSPFSLLEVPVSAVPMGDNFMRKWVQPFHLNLLNLYEVESKVVAEMSPLVSEVNKELVLALLAEFNWRPRLVGAYLIAVKRLSGLEDTIGRLLLRSDVCYAAQGYCLALAELNTSAGVEYLRKYLDYYLGQENLWFDQGDAMAALHHLDEVNQTNLLAVYREKWHGFVANKPYWDMQRNIKHFQERVSFVKAVREACAVP